MKSKEIAVAIGVLGLAWHVLSVIKDAERYDSQSDSVAIGADGSEPRQLAAGGGNLDRGHQLVLKR